MKNNRPPHWAIKLTAIIGAAGIILGAFGSHGLEGILEKMGMFQYGRLQCFII